MTMLTKRGMKTFLLPALVTLAALSGAAGCRQKMADQPYYRPLEESDFFSDGRASRPLERGVIHRAQRLETDPMVTGLTVAEWKLVREVSTPIAKIDAPALTDAERRARAAVLPRSDQRVPGVPKVFVEEYPFQITQADLSRGQERYTIFCAVCHGPLGNGMGKIRERGYLTPTSFHTQVVNAEEEQQRKRAEELGKEKKAELGLSRNYLFFSDIRMPMDEAPVGYYFEVITKGYGGMPSYSAQISPEDRWRIIAYIRALQMTQAGGKK